MKLAKLATVAATVSMGLLLLVQAKPAAAQAAAVTTLTCQQMSDTYGITHNKTWGTATAAVQDQWMKKGCSTSAQAKPAASPPASPPVMNTTTPHPTPPVMNTTTPHPTPPAPPQGCKAGFYLNTWAKPAVCLASFPSCPVGTTPYPAPPFVYTTGPFVQEYCVATAAPACPSGSILTANGCVVAPVCPPGTAFVAAANRCAVTTGCQAGSTLVNIGPAGLACLQN